jgi:hypothetical protein
MVIRQSTNKFNSEPFCLPIPNVLPPNYGVTNATPGKYFSNRAWLQAGVLISAGSRAAAF